MRLDIVNRICAEVCIGESFLNDGLLSLAIWGGKTVCFAVLVNCAPFYDAQYAVTVSLRVFEAF